MNFRRTFFVLFSFLYVLGSLSPAFAISEEEKQFLLMYFKEEELEVVSTTRSLKSISRIAENVEVVTADDIELMNAHTLADLLNTVTGVQVFFGGASPTSLANVDIQGSKYENVAFFIDGVPINGLDTNLVIVSDIPVQMIDKVEIIKGPASSVWGSSLGGVVNIITKSAPGAEEVGGMVSASYGEENTADLRAEITARKDKFGFYVTAGRLSTDGLRKYEDGWRNDVYAKLSYDLSQDSGIIFTLGYGRNKRERGDSSELDYLDRDKFERLFSTLSLYSAIDRNIRLDFSLRALHQRLNFYSLTPSTGDEFSSYTDDTLYGGSVKLTWIKGGHTVVVGSDYDDGELESDSYSGDLSVRKWAIFVNDTIELGKLSITPGIRYDIADPFDNFVSPSLGVTYQLFDKTILRAYIARGFNNPGIGQTSGDFGYFRHNPGLGLEKVWSYQAGIETGLLKYLWLKTSGFRHDIKDAITWDFVDADVGTWTYVNKDKVRRQGVEVEFKTVPVFNTALSFGAAFIDTEDRETGEDIKDVPKYTYDVGLHYEDNKGLRALLKGHYIWFNALPYHTAKYSTLIFDINIIKSVYHRGNQNAELFLTGHNIFNGSQYWDNFYMNAERWVEGGIRYKF